MIRAILLVALAAMPAASAVIRGSVVENFSGKLLARALVTLEPMPGTPGQVRTLRTSRLGGFEFDSLPAGVYVLKASRRGFLPAEYGQKRWNSSGRPVYLEESATAFLTIRLPHASAVSGTVVDENEIGLPGAEVGVYKTTQPPEFIRSATADDRGVYRVGGLDPGRYLVRTAARQYEDGSYLPTFSRETIRADQAESVEVFPEQQTEHIDVRPLPGKLCTLTVAAAPLPPDVEDEPVITLASSMGRTTIKGLGHIFRGLAPGEYEVYTQAGLYGSYERFVLTGDRTHSALWNPPARVTVSGYGSESDGRIRVRRRDLAGVGAEAVLPMGRAVLPVGRWDILLEAPEGFYASDAFSYRDGGRLDSWLDVILRPRLSFGYRLSSGAGSIRGTVKEAAYAPVFLEPYDSRLRKRAGEVKVARADARGQFRFANLAPGTYRLLSTFEYVAPDSDVFDGAAPASIVLERNADEVKEIELWTIR